MKLIFSRRSEILRGIAQDDFERKQLIEKWLQFRGVLLWTALPLVISLLAFVSGLTVFYVSLKNEKSGAALFLKSMDIISAFGGVLVILTFACLYFIFDTDRSLRRLSSFRLDDPEPPPNARNREVAPSVPADTDNIITEETVIASPAFGLNDDSPKHDESSPRAES